MRNLWFALVSSTFAEASRMQAEAQASYARDRARSADDRADGRNVTAMTGVKYEHTLPVLLDKDWDFEKHLRVFEGILHCTAVSGGRTRVRPLDELMLYRQCFEPGGVRRMTFEQMYDKAHKQRRLPHEAAEVLAEIRTRLRKMLKLTPYEHRERLDGEFARLQQGRSSHAEFRAKWENLIDDMQDAGMSIAIQDRPEVKADLCRMYCRKLTDDLRSAVMNKIWNLDGDERPERKPSTWEEVAECVEMELMARTDVRTHLDRFNVAVDGTGGGKKTKAQKKADKTGRLAQAPSGGGLRTDSINAVPQDWQVQGGPPPPGAPGPVLSNTASVRIINSRIAHCERLSSAMKALSILRNISGQGKPAQNADVSITKNVITGTRVLTQPM